MSAGEVRAVLGKPWSYAIMRKASTGTSRSTGSSRAVYVCVRPGELTVYAKGDVHTLQLVFDRDERLELSEGKCTLAPVCMMAGVSQSDFVRHEELARVVIEGAVLPDASKAASGSDFDDLLEASKAGGARGVYARYRLVEAGYSAMLPIVQEMEELDLADGDDHMFLYEMNEVLREIVAGAVDPQVVFLAGDHPTPSERRWNALVIVAWRHFIERVDGESALQQFVSEAKQSLLERVRPR
jgi:hypothetical protein